MDKLMHTVWPDLTEVSPVSVQTDEVVPTVPVVVEGATRTSYASLATQTSGKVVAPAPVGP